MTSNKNERRNLMLDAAVVHHEIGHLWALNVIVWSSTGLIVLIIIFFSSFAEIYRVPGVTEMQTVSRVWAVDESEFKRIPALKEEGGIEYADDSGIDIPEFLLPSQRINSNETDDE